MVRLGSQFLTVDPAGSRLSLTNRLGLTVALHVRVTTRTRAGREQSARQDQGFTVIEVVSALLLLAVAAAGVGALVAASERAAAQARVQTSATTLALQKIEQLRSLLWHVDVGTPVSDLSTNLAVDPPVPGGLGLSPSPADSLVADEAGSVDYLDGLGVWMAGGSEPPAGAVFVRRWRVVPLAEDPENTLCLVVRVLTVMRSRQPASAVLVPNAPGESVLSTVLTRKLR